MTPLGWAGVWLGLFAGLYIISMSDRIGDKLAEATVLASLLTLSAWMIVEGIR